MFYTPLLLHSEEIVTRIEELREKANRLPLLPGVYIMLDASGEVIYVGKAKALKNRVTSYFRGDHLPKVAAMVSHVNDFNVIIAESEFEALVLENSLIKRHKPHYNILLKDDKGYPFLRLDRREKYPRFSLSNRANPDGARYYGPYGGRGQTMSIIDTLSKALGLPTCRRVFPRDIGKDRPCLQFQMGACRGWCRGEPGEEEYRRAIDAAADILEGRTAELLHRLEEEMNTAAGELRFEEAARLRDRMRAVSTLENRQRVIAAARADTDAVGFARGAKSCFSVLHYTNGDLSGKDVSLIDDPTETDEEALSALLRQYYVNRSALPKTILLPFAPEDREDIERWLSDMAGRRVYLEVPQRGDRARFAEKAAVNAREEILRSTTAEQRRSKTLAWLQEALRLPEFPHRIEAYDISNTGSTGIVASMTVHVDGKPLKRDYRKFRIRSTETPDDYASMREVITRRFTHYLEEDGKFSARPDVLFIDGGAEHASAACALSSGAFRRRRTALPSSTTARCATACAARRLTRSPASATSGGTTFSGRSDRSAPSARRRRRRFPKLFRKTRRTPFTIISIPRRKHHASDHRQMPRQTPARAGREGRPSHHRSGEGGNVQYHPVRCGGTEGPRSLCRNGTARH